MSDWCYMHRLTVVFAGGKANGKVSRLGINDQTTKLSCKTGKEMIAVVNLERQEVFL